MRRSEKIKKKPMEKFGVLITEDSEFCEKCGIVMDYWGHDELCSICVNDKYDPENFFFKCDRCSNDVGVDSDCCDNCGRKIADIVRVLSANLQKNEKLHKK